ncbi:MAG: hypothetical protein ACTMUB_00580 [cyanobacterium endosymbiont of Rhopalodia musculus]|uniref:hypothetical protein n=1 Tax=cyanobacterium endosymbiont of Epithemia clementina EcSB TaxID=3034674 RepID=UPI00248099B0|nr:hypothetical protein [cyanobacterium endosymbiont of Epithemia clementina EcSB]WGT66773.1 hypothetical protein P3F56_05805 [cyanobacterium endosymbiont of Epithemia clementina EcSB]
MLGNFQESHLRIAVDVNESTIGNSLLKTKNLRKWLIPQTLSSELPDTLEAGIVFTSWLGFVSIRHQVEIANENSLRLILSQGIDGYHEWVWGDGWVQSRLEGISLLPLKLGQTFDLLKLRQFVLTKEQNKLDKKEF